MYYLSNLPGWSMQDEIRHIETLGTAKKKIDDPPVTRELHIKRLKGYIQGLAKRVRLDNLDYKTLRSCARQELGKLKR